MKKGRDYEESFAPTAHQETLQLVLFIACAYGLRLHKCDIINFFLNGEDQKETFCEPPEEMGLDKKYALRLNASVYGTASAPHQAAKLVDKMMEDSGMVPLESDSRLFIKKAYKGTNKAYWLLCLVHVDDLLIAYHPDEGVQGLRANFANHFQLTEDPNPSSFTGLEISRGVSASSGRPYMHLGQYQKVIDFLKCIGMENSNPCTTPLATLNTTAQVETKKESRGRSKPYMTAVGKLIWLLRTRLETCYATSLRCSAMSDSSPNDDLAVKRLARYLNGTRTHGLHFEPAPNTSTLVAYCDASFADRDDGKSTGGLAIGFAGDTPEKPAGIILAKSFKQRLQAHSTLESEYYAADETVKAVEWARGAMQEMGLPQTGPTIIYTDNRALVDLCSNPVLHARTKHFKLRQAYLRNRIQHRIVKFVHIPGENNLADILTKPLPGPRFAMLRDKFMSTATSQGNSQAADVPSKD